MDNKINLSQLAERLAQEGGMSKAAAEQFVKNFFDIISQRVLSEGLVKVKGLGTFKLIQMEDRESVNVNTGERFTIEGHQKISFVPDADLKERINKPFAAFDTVEITKEQADELAKMESDKDADDSEPEEKPQPVKEEKKSAKEKRLAQKQAQKAEAARKKAEKQLQKEPQKGDANPTVKDITQKKSTRCLLKVLIGILITILVLGLTLFMLWPLVGNRVLDIVDKSLNKEKIEVVKEKQSADPVEEAVKKEEVKDAPAQEPAAKPAEKPADKPAVQPAQPQNKPAEPAAKPAEKPAQTKPATETKYPVVKLNAQDEAKDLSEFTLADVVNYTMDGELTTHKLLKGETLTVVALKYYGSKKLWPYIAKYNNIKDPARLSPGIIIKVPVLKSK
jgi:nucleoid DNA-binding protein